MAGDKHDPRTEAEKARADLVRNSQLDMAVPESPLESRPSVTPRTSGTVVSPGRSAEGRRRACLLRWHEGV